MFATQTPAERMGFGLGMQAPFVVLPFLYLLVKMGDPFPDAYVYSMIAL